MRKLGKPCFTSQIKDYPFSQEDIADIWDLGKERYIDPMARALSANKNYKSPSDPEIFQAVLDGLARDLGMRKEHIAQAFTTNKVVRALSNEMWKTMHARRNAINGAQNFVESINDSRLKKLIETAYNVPRSALTFGHGGVFPVTHMGGLATSGQWLTFLKTSGRAWSYFGKAGEARYEIAIQRHLADPYYDIARRASASVDPNQQTVGILKNMKGWTGRGFNSLKIARLEIFKKEFSKLAPEEQVGERGLENAKPIMNRIDHLTGEINLGKAGKWLSWTFFAPKLLPARFAAGVIDPIRAANTFRPSNWAKATAGERQAARFVAKTAAQKLAFYGGLLALNEGVNLWVGAEHHVNLTDPSQKDWLAFKIGGLTLRPPNDLIEALRFVGNITVPYVRNQAALHGQQPTDVALHNAADYFRYKFHPAIQDVFEAASGTDLFGRPLPKIDLPVIGQHTLGLRPLVTGEAPKETKIRPALSWPEYAIGKGPIPFGGAAREVYDLLREEGMSHTDIKLWMKAAAVGVAEAEGIAAHETKEPAIKVHKGRGGAAIH